MATENETTHQAALKVLLCGGIAGVVTWGSVFPLDMIKTRLQAHTIRDIHGSSGTISEGQSLLRPHQPLNTLQMTIQIFRAEGLGAFYRGLGVCSVRAFIVNAVQVGSLVFHG